MNSPQGWWRRVSSVPRLHLGIVVFALLLIAGLWTAVAHVVRNERESAVEAAIARSDDLAIAFEHYAIRTIESADTALRYLIQESPLPNGRFSLAHLDLTHPLENKAFINITLADAKGDGISIASGSRPATAVGVADREHFIVHRDRDTGSLYVGKPVKGRVVEKYVVPLSRRINNADGSFGGVAIAVIEPARFTDVFDASRLKRLDVVTLVGFDGIVRARLEDAKTTWGENIGHGAIFDEQRTQSSGHYLAKSQLDGIARFFSYRRLPEYKVIAIVGVAEVDALAAFTGRRNLYYSAAGLASFAIVAFTTALIFALAAQHRAMGGLVKGHARYRATFSRVPVGIARSDLAGRFLETNPALHDILGYPDDAILGRTFTQITWPEDVGKLDELHRGAMQEEQAANSDPVEVRLVKSDGSIAWCALTASLVRDGTDGAGYAITVIKDVTELKQVMHDLQDLNVSLERRVEERTLELETANRAKSTFLATMSHEIRTPLNGVIGMLELLSFTQLNASQRTSIEVVRQSGRSLVRIIDDILDYSKIEAGKLAIQGEVASVDSVLRAVAGLYSGAAQSKGLSLTSAFDERIGAAHWFDPQRLQQILNNFVSNAIKFTDKGHVQIRAESVETLAETQSILFTVADTGIGISPDDQKRLFQPFTQIEAASTRRFGGTGLGLSISRQLAEMMGGSIRVESVSGAGTTFILNLVFPMADPAQLPAERQSTPPEAAPAALEWRAAPDVEQALAEGTLVLVVDDHAVNRMVLMQQVRALGYAGETAENGLEGLEKWRSGRYGIVLADCNMPVMDGYEMVRQIRAEEADTGRKRTPIIACTANALAGESEKTFAAGMDDYMAKPLNLRDVHRKMDSWLPLPNAGRPLPVPPPSDVPTRPPTTSEHAVDAVVLAALSHGNASTQRELIALFRSVNDQDAADLRRLISGQDGAATKSAAHRIKGASRMLGAFRLAAIAEQIEAAGHGRDWPEIAIAMPPFEAELTRVNTFLDSLGPLQATH